MIIRYKIHHIVLLISFKNQYITIITAILYIFIQHNSYTCQEKFQKKFVFFPWIRNRARHANAKLWKNAYFSIPFEMKGRIVWQWAKTLQISSSKILLKILRPMTNNLFPIYRILCNTILCCLRKVMQLPLTGCRYSYYAHLHNLYSTLTK